MTSRYQWTLSDELLQKASENLNEPTDNHRRLEEIDKLKAKFDESFKEQDDAFYLKFLRSAKFDIEYAYRIILDYLKQREGWPEVFEKVDNPERLSSLFDHGFALPLSSVANDGSYVVLGRAAIAFQHTDDPTDFVAMVILTIETLLKDEEFQISGYHVIQDMTDITLPSIFKMASVARRLIKESLPINLKSLNVVNEYAFFDIVYTIAKNFMKGHIRKILTVHGREYTKLHQLVGKELLPASIGGEWEINEKVIQEWKDRTLGKQGRML